MLPRIVIRRALPLSSWVLTPPTRLHAASAEEYGHSNAIGTAQHRLQTGSDPQRAAVRKVWLRDRRSCRVGWPPTVHRSQHWPRASGVYTYVDNFARTRRASPPRLQGDAAQAAAICIRGRARLRQRSVTPAHPARAPGPWTAAEGPTANGPGSSGSPVARGWPR